MANRRAMGEYFSKIKLESFVTPAGEFCIKTVLMISAKESA